MTVLTPHPLLLLPNPRNLRCPCRSTNISSALCFSTISTAFRSNSSPSFSSFRTRSAFSGEERKDDPIPGRISGKNPGKNDEIIDDSDQGAAGKAIDKVDGSAAAGIASGADVSPTFVDEWGEKSEAEPEDSLTKLSEADTPKDEDEWGEESKFDYSSGNGSPGFDRLGDLKTCLVDTVYGTDFGLRTTAEVRAEVFELINQLEAANPTPAPTEALSLLDGNWILLYTAFSELLPLIAVGTLPLLKLQKICQTIDTGSFTILNSATYSSPFATFSFSASASFEVRTASRIQVKFREGIIRPPELLSSVNLPENIEFFGQKIDLSSLQRSLNPLQETAARISRVISGQPPLKIPIPGDRAESWLLVTYLDEDLRISRGDTGLFVLVKEGSLLLNR